MDLLWSPQQVITFSSTRVKMKDELKVVSFTTHSLRYRIDELLLWLQQNFDVIVITEAFIDTLIIDFILK